MKKLLYIAIAALVALTACTKVDMEEYNPDRKVTFQVASYAQQTKANSSIWSEFTSFTAKAFLHAEGYTAANQTQDFFGAAGQLITPYTSAGAAATTEASVSYWAPSHDFFWPKGSDSYLNFIAWYDAKGTTPATATETSLSWTDYTVLSTDNLLVAEEAWHYKENTSNSLYTGDPVAAGVPMLFRHALAQVAFKAYETNASSNGMTRTVTVNSLSLSNVYSTGSVSLTNAGSTTRTTVPWVATGNVWTPSGTAASMAMSSATTLTTSSTDLISLRTVLPQTVTDDMVLTVTYKISTYYGNSETAFSEETITLSEKLNELVSVIPAWEMGHRIIYTLVFDLSTDLIQIQPTLQNWDANIGGGGVTLE